MGEGDKGDFEKNWAFDSPYLDIYLVDVRPPLEFCKTLFSIHVTVGFFGITKQMD